MRLVASVIVRNELGRYLEPFVEHLLTFCDDIAALDDGLTDGTREVFRSHDIGTGWRERSSMFEHEGRARQALLDFTLSLRPTHVLSVDADEFVSDGAAIRAACEADEGNGAWTLEMEEVWKADDNHLWTRQDGGWKSHRIPILWRAPSGREAETGGWRILDRALACGREPEIVRTLAARAPATGASVLHLGWAREADRAARYQRYVDADNGRFHASRHLQSIMWPDRRVRLRGREWPAALEPWKAQILGSANQLALA